MYFKYKKGAQKSKGQNEVGKMFVPKKERNVGMRNSNGSLFQNDLKGNVPRIEH